ncbi:MAG: hypothetical protein HUU50_06595 [Candidatus Brocadiae bacterium]|nr:hypothetical protein [Candidatus Brocadiia bacterium]
MWKLHQKKAEILLALFWLINIGIFADWTDRFAIAREVSLSELLEKPEAWLGVPVRIPIRFFEPSDVYVPYRTRFSPDSFWNFSAWDIQSHIWDPTGFEKTYPYFYVEKDNPEFKFFQKLETFKTICILAQIEGIFAGKPFIRVVWASAMPGNLHINNLKLLHKGLKLYKQRNFREAMGLFQKVFDSNPPEDIKVMLHKAIAKYYIYEKKSYYSAIEELKKAHSINPTDVELEELAYLCHLYSRPQVQGIPSSNTQQNPTIPLGQHSIILEPDPLPQPTPEQEPESKTQEPKVIKEPVKKEMPKKPQPEEPKIVQPKPEEPSNKTDILDDLEQDKEITEPK